jgi:hypothetical protein
MPMAWLTLREHAAVGHIERGKQCRRAVADVVVRDAFHVPQAHGQNRLGPLQSLHLALLIHTQHQRVIRRTQIQADDIAHFLDEKRTGRELEATAAMRLQAKERQVAVHGGLGKPGLIGQAPPRPVRFAFGSLLQRRMDQLGNLLLIGVARPPRFEFVVKAGDAALAKAHAPQTYRRARGVAALGNPRAAQSRSRHQHDLRPHQSVRQALGARHRFQLHSLLFGQRDLRIHSRRRRVLPPPRDTPWTAPGA